MSSPTPEVQNISFLSGSPSPISFSAWWNKETDNSNIKTQTVGFMDPLLLFLQNENCNIIDKDEVLGFLNNNIGIMDYLYRAPGILREKFGNIGLNLNLIVDPGEESDGTLFLEALTGLATKESLEKLDELVRDWLLPNVGQDITKFNIDVSQK